MEDTMSCLCSWLRTHIHTYQVIRLYLFAFPLSLCAHDIKEIGGGKVKSYKDIAATNTHSEYVTGFLYPVILSGALFTSSTVQTDNSPEITRYTLQREKSSPADNRPDIARHTLQREKSSEVISSTLQSGKGPEIEINEQSGVYQIKVVALIAAPASYVRYVLTDYKHIYRLNPSIIESEVLKQYDDGSVSVRTKVIGCAAYFCEELDRVEKVRMLPSGDLHAEIIPELSQFKSGQTHWRIRQLGDYCEVTYLSDMEPDIYILPVVGTFLIKKSIREGMHTSFTNLEKISSVLAEREWLNNDQAITATSNSPCNTCVSNPLTASE